MKRISKILIGLLIVLGTFASAHAQIKSYIDFAIFDEDNAVALDSTNIYVHIGVKSSITNNDTTVNGNLMYWFKTGKSIDLYGTNYYYSIDNDPNYETIPYGGKLDTIRFFCDTTYLNPKISETGPVNVIIIWPAFNGTVPLVDSGEYLFPSLMIENPWIGIEEENGQMKYSTIHPNPAEGEQIVFLTPKQTQSIEKFAIISARGEVVAVKVFGNPEKSKGYVLPTSELRPGLYYIQVYYEGYKYESIKFIKN